MEGSEPSEIPPRVTGVHRLILARLWHGGWVTAGELREATGQSEWARRLRELRQEFGYPIAQNGTGLSGRYRLEGRTPGFTARRRVYFTNAQKRQITEATGNGCNICKKSPGDGTLRGKLCWDHRTPFDRGGPTVAENGQPLCVMCNNLKKQACGLCEEPDCSGCLFCTPERADSTVVIGFDEGTMARLREVAERLGVDVPTAVVEAVNRGLSSESQPDRR